MERVQEQAVELEDGMDRREFTLRALMTMLAGVTITIGGCGGGGGGSTGGGGNPAGPTANPSSDDKLGNIDFNHGHRAVITQAELTAGNGLVLQIRGDANHPHTVSLSAADIVAIRAGQRVGRASSEDDFHTHTVTFN